MQAKNRYAQHARISERKLRMIVKLFACGESATLISRRTGMNRNTINKYINQIRREIAANGISEEVTWDALEYDAYFEDLRRKDKSGLLCADRSFALRCCPETGEIRIRFFPVATSAEVWKVIARRAAQNEDRSWRSYDILGFRKTFRGNWDNRPVSPHDPRDILSLFWESVRERLIVSHGVPSSVFWLHLRESEFRFNHRREDLYGVLLAMLKENPLSS